MIVHPDIRNAAHVKFVSYTGKKPSLCMGILTLEINGKEMKFGHDFIHPDNNYDKFWKSGGSCDHGILNQDNWKIDFFKLPFEVKLYYAEIKHVFNANVPHGCCGGCINR